MITIWFEAHATTHDNEAKQASGWYDVDLSELGISQTLEPIERSTERGIQAIFCSDMQRAYKSAVPTAKKLHIPIYVDERLRECNYGDYEHQPSHVIESERPNRITTPFPNGESYEDCVQRVAEFLEWLKLNFDDMTIMIIGHRATQYGLRHYIHGEELTSVVRESFTYQPGWKYELQ